MQKNNQSTEGSAKLPSSQEKVILVHIDFPQNDSFTDDLEEFKMLAYSAGANVIEIITGSKKTPEPKYFVGLGKAEEIKQAVAAHHADLVLFNHPLSPSQERNLEKLFQCRVLDRYGLILDIFASRARTFEGKLQVELAQLQRLSTRLVRGWTHLERQKGGIGLRGPGETQLETDRRLIRDRIRHIEQRLEKVKSQRLQSRRTRRRSAIPTVALVGYTNAGKSTLFNRLSQSEVYVADQLFATLDPTLRRIELPHAGVIIIADTVGFIRHLPHELIEAFSATLEETRDADLLLHVIDVHDDEKHSNIEQVNLVLTQIEANNVPQLMVYNKIDLTANNQPHIERDEQNKPKQVWISASQNIGIDLLLKALTELLFGEPIRRHVLLTPQQAALRAELYRLKAIESETTDDEGNWLLSICISKTDFERLFK